MYLALSLYEENGDNRMSHLAVLNMKDRTTQWLFEYPSVNWSSVDIAWSPDSHWVAFLPGNVAFGDDGDLWIFEINQPTKYQYRRATSVEGWDENSKKVYFGFKDGFGFINMQNGDVTFGERCP
jgi:hypothetical protein